MKSRFAMGLAAVGALSAGMAARAQLIDQANPTPVVDRWMYNFATQTGVEQNASIFTSLGDPLQLNFDDRDGQFLLAWDTAGTIPSGLAVNRYRIISATVVARNSRSSGFRFDPTYDARTTYLPATDPLYTADSDLGRPIEMYISGYRNGWDRATFTETSPFCSAKLDDPASCEPTTLPKRGVRNVFAAQYDSGGVVQDVSNSVLGPTGTGGGFDPRPIAVGVATSNSDQPNPVAPGALVPLYTDFTFAIDLTNPDAVRNLRESLASGRVGVAITALAPSAMMGGSPPRFYTKEAAQQIGDPRIKAASLSLKVCVGPPADWDCNQSVQIDDIFVYLNAWFAGNADFDANGQTTIDDIFLFLNAWFAS